MLILSILTKLNYPHIKKHKDNKCDLTLVNLNIRSLKKNYDNLKIFIEQTDYDIICLTETWLTNDLLFIKLTIITIILPIGHIIEEEVF